MEPASSSTLASFREHDTERAKFIVGLYAYVRSSIAWDHGVAPRLYAQSTRLLLSKTS